MDQHPDHPPDLVSHRRHRSATGRHFHEAGIPVVCHVQVLARVEGDPPGVAEARRVGRFFVFATRLRDLEDPAAPVRHVKGAVARNRQPHGIPGALGDVGIGIGEIAQIDAGDLAVFRPDVELIATYRDRLGTRYREDVAERSASIAVDLAAGLGADVQVAVARHGDPEWIVDLGDEGGGLRPIPHHHRPHVRIADRLVANVDVAGRVLRHQPHRAERRDGMDPQIIAGEIVLEDAAALGHPHVDDAPARGDAARRLAHDREEGDRTGCRNPIDDIRLGGHQVAALPIRRDSERQVDIREALGNRLARGHA
ncbi:hypothetical protein D3C86_1301800 [compost metagenome]